MNPPAVPSAPSPVALRNDFPGWLSPMLVKELRQSLRTKGFVSLFVVFHLLAIAAFWSAIEINAVSGQRSTFDWVNGLYWSLLYLVMLLIVPLRGLGALRSEIDSKTIDLLVLTNLTSWRIVLGKWVALVAQGALFLIALLPYGVVRYFFGSVDLAGDLVQVLWALVVSAVLGALAIWVSGLPKIFRILLPIGLLFTVQNAGISSFMYRGMSSRGSSTGPSMLFVGFGWGQAIGCVVLVAVFLGLAVRRIAPPAENHALVARVLALLLVLGLIISPQLTAYVSLRNASAMAFAFFALIALLEMSRDCLPMYAHWRPWRQRGPVHAALGRCCLPGWPSAALFAAAGLALLALPALFLSGWRADTNASLFTYLWWLMLGWQALVFPAVLLSFLPASSALRIGGPGYFVVHGLFGIFNLMAVTNQVSIFNSAPFTQVLDSFCQVLPVASFWLGSAHLKDGFSSGNLIGQAVMLLTLLVLCWRQARPYWGTLRRFDQPAPRETTATQ